MFKQKHGKKHCCGVPLLCLAEFKALLDNWEQSGHKSASKMFRFVEAER